MHQVARDARQPRRRGDGSERDTGLAAVGRVPSGSHFCIFYETKQDLLDILVPYFKTGLLANEYCLWIVTPYEFLSTDEAEEALASALPEFKRYLAEKRMDLLSYEDAFDANGSSGPERAVACIRKKVRAAERRGRSGLRLNGSSAWVRQHRGAAVFRAYEHGLDKFLSSHPLIIACTFPIHLARAKEILDAAETHQFAVTVRKGVWTRVEIGDIKAARGETLQPRSKLDKLTFRQREILQRIAEGQNTKEIAAVLGRSTKTIEAHRLNLMKKLGIRDVPGLVRFAIRSGLVSAEF